MKKIVLAVCLLTCEGWVYAQQARQGFSGFAFTSPLEISGGADRNFLIDRTTPAQRLFFLSLPPSVLPQTPLAEPKQFNDQVLLLNLPNMSFLKDTRRVELAVNYRPEFELFRKNGDQNAWNHDFSTGFAYLIRPKTEVFVGDMYRSTQDPARTMQAVSLLLPRSRYKENSFRTAVSHSFSERTRFEVRFDDTVTTFTRIDPFQIRVLDTRSTGGALVFTRMLGRADRIRGSYSLMRTRPIDKVEEGDENVDVDRTGMREPIHTVASSYQHVFGRTAAAEFTGGVVKAEAGNSFVFVVSADKRFGEMAVGGAFSRTLMFYAGDRRFLAPGLRSNDIYEVATFRLRGWLKPKVAMDLNIAGSRDASPIFIKRTKSLMGRFRMDYRFHERTSMFFTVETYRQNRNEFVGAPLARNRVFVGLQYSINEDPYRRITDFAMEPEYIGLPGRGRRR